MCVLWGVFGHLIDSLKVKRMGRIEMALISFFFSLKKVSCDKKLKLKGNLSIIKCVPLKTFSP